MAKTNETKTVIGGYSLSMVLFLVFLTLKLTDNIDWSWWWVCSPLWIPVCVMAIMLLAIFLVELLKRR